MKSYFTHDSGARNDPRIVSLRRKFGWEGYGSFFGLIEFLREQPNYQIQEDRITDVLFDLRISDEIFLEMVKSGLIITEDSHYFSASLKNRMRRMDEINTKRQLAAHLGGVKSALSRRGQKASKWNADCSSDAPKEKIHSKNTILPSGLTEPISNRKGAACNTVCSTINKDNIILDENKIKKEEISGEISATRSVARVSKKTVVEVAIPEVLNDKDFLKSWKYWMQYRKERHATMTVRTKELQLKKLAELGPEKAVATIERSVENGWLGIFPQDKIKNPDFDALNAIKDL